MWQHFLFGLLLGWGAAVPIGPVNLEIIRRNLSYGFYHGLLFSLGVCCADTTYLVLVAVAALTIFKNPLVLQILAVVGGIVFLLFVYGPLKVKNREAFSEHHHPENKLSQSAALWPQFFLGYLMAIVSPFALLFWTSAGTQIALVVHQSNSSPIYLISGTLTAILSWDLGLNYFLHRTRHFLPQKVIQIFNYVGGVILIGFAGYAFWHIFL